MCPQIYRIPLPPIPLLAIEPAAGPVESSSEGYEIVRDDSLPTDTVFEMPAEVHSWQARLFGYPVPNSDQYYNISFVNNCE